MITDRDAHELLKWIAENQQMESIYATPDPQSSVPTIGLLDKIAELREMNQIFNGREYNRIVDSLKTNQP